MKIIFQDKSYIDCFKSEDGSKIIIMISAKDQSNPLKKITNSVELNLDQFENLISNIK